MQANTGVQYQSQFVRLLNRQQTVSYAYHGYLTKIPSTLDTTVSVVYTCMLENSTAGRFSRISAISINSNVLPATSQQRVGSRRQWVVLTESPRRVPGFKAVSICLPPLFIDSRVSSSGVLSRPPEPFCGTRRMGHDPTVRSCSLQFMWTSATKFKTTKPNGIHCVMRYV